MVTEKDMAEEQGDKPAPVVLSTGAGIALGNVFKRVNKQRSTRDKAAGSTGKRPRPISSSVVLAANEEVREVIRDQKREKKRLKEARKAKLQFESNARVIPDAATNAAMEKEFLMTATKGAVALFNAVSKAQKAAEEAANKPKKKGGPPVSRDSFMNMMRAGVAKGETDSKMKHAENVSDEEGTAPKSKAKWLKDDFLTAKSKTLRDWDRDADIGYEEGSSGSEVEPDGGESGDGGEEDEEESLESSGESENDSAESGDSES